MAGKEAPDRRLFKEAYSFPSQMGTFGGIAKNGGALFGGDVRQFPDADFNNSFDAPFHVKRIKFYVGRVQGGNEVDSDYNEALARITGTLRDSKFSKNPAALSTLCDRQRREWLLEPGEMVLGTQNGGITIEMTVVSGSIGAPFNISADALGVFQRYNDVSESMIPPGGPTK